MGLGGQRHAPAAFPPGRPGTHCIGGCVGPRASLDGCGKSAPPPPGFDLRGVQPVANRYTDLTIPAHDLHNGYRDIPEVKRPGRGVSNLPPPSVKVTGRIELYLYCPSVPPWPLIGRTLPLYLRKSPLPYKVLSCNFHCCAGQT